MLEPAAGVGEPCRAPCRMPFASLHHVA
jgi:hypothetical protein